MSELVIVALITVIGPMLTLLVKDRIDRNRSKRLEEKITEKVDSYHKEVNGKMGELLVTTKALGNAEGKAEQKETEK